MTLKEKINTGKDSLTTDRFSTLYLFFYSIGL